MSWSEQALRLPAAGQALQGPTTWGSSDAFWLVQSASASPGRPTLVLTAQPSDAERLSEEIAWFEPNLRIQHFPDWETLPYDQFSPHQDLISERLKALWRMQRGDIDLIIAPVSTAAMAIAPRAMISGRSFVFDAATVSVQTNSRHNSLKQAMNTSRKSLNPASTASAAG